MIQIEQAQVYWPTINSNEELIFKIRINKIDYTDELRQDIFSLARNWTAVAVVMKDFWEPQPERIEEKRAKLDWWMKKYAEEIQRPFSEVLNEFYDKKKIKSRTELTAEQLDWAIESFKAWVSAQ